MSVMFFFVRHPPATDLIKQDPVSNTKMASLSSELNAPLVPIELQPGLHKGLGISLLYLECLDCDSVQLLS